MSPEPTQITEILLSTVTFQLEWCQHGIHEVLVDSYYMSVSRIISRILQPISHRQTVLISDVICITKFPYRNNRYGWLRLLTSKLLITIDA